MIKNNWFQAIMSAVWCILSLIAVIGGEHDKALQALQLAVIFALWADVLK